jgi:hypothetical protein
LIEPGDGSFVRTGDGWPYTFWQRDDKTAQSPGVDAKDGERWWDCADEDGAGDGPFDWAHVAAQADPQLVKFQEVPR